MRRPPSRWGSLLMLSMAFVSAPVAPAQQAKNEQEMVVLAGPGRPSTMLGGWLSARQERFVIADVGLWVHDLVGVDLASVWREVEQKRRSELLAILTGLCRHFGAADSRSDGLAGVAHVAHVLLAKQKGGARTLPEPWRSELNAVIRGGSAPLACGGDGKVVNWADAVPRGAYGDHDDLDALFATTWYLGTCLHHFDEAQSKPWQDALAALPESARTQHVDGALRALFGTSPPPMPGLLGEPTTSAALADREVLARAGTLAERLDAVHRLEPGDGADLRTSIFRIAHELATADPDDAWLSAFGHAQWRQKWSDLADYAYVAVREVDGIFGYRDIPPEGDHAQLLIEPLPEVFAALRRAYVAADAVKRIASGERGEGSKERLAEIDDALALLAHQRAGTQPPADLLARLWECLEHGFNKQGGDSVVTRLEGTGGPVRRSGCYLVRVPIRWQGEDTTAVTFHWFVETRTRTGHWLRVRR